MSGIPVRGRMDPGSSRLQGPVCNNFDIYACLTIHTHNKAISRIQNVHSVECEKGEERRLRIGTPQPLCR